MTAARRRPLTGMGPIPKGKNPSALLAEFFKRNGYIRLPNRNRRRSEKAEYKKGYEVRLVLFNSKELEQVSRCLRQVGLKPGLSFLKHDRVVLPLYGRQAVETFLKWSGKEKN